ncbi:MAG: 50S ribosomal protein L35 [Christensenellales bacterium]
MPKMKTKSGAKKRFRVKKNGDVKYTRMNKRHILTKKSTKVKRNARKGQYLSSDKQAKTVRTLVQG